MKRLLLYCILLGFIYGCGHLPDRTGAIPIKWHKTEQAWREVAKLTGRKGSLAVGFTFEHDGVCHVYAPDMKFSDCELYILGHEIKHCFDGTWHKNYQQPLPRVVCPRPSSVSGK